MLSSSALTCVSTTFLNGAFGKSRESKLMAAASNVPAIRRDTNIHVESIVIQESEKYNDCVRGFDYFKNSTLNDLPVCAIY